MSIPVSFAFAVGSSFMDGSPFEATIHEVINRLLRANIISSKEPTSLGPGKSLVFTAGERIREHSTGVSVLHDGGNPIPVMLDTHSDPDTFPQVAILVVLHDFVPIGYDQFCSELQQVFGEDCEDYVVAL